MQQSISKTGFFKYLITSQFLNAFSTVLLSGVMDKMVAKKWLKAL